VRNLKLPNWQRWTKVVISASAVTLLGTCTPLPGLIDQIKTLGELRVVTRNGPLAFYRGPDNMPEGPEYELARRFADELGVKLKITPMRTYAEIYAALTSGHAHLAAAGLKVPSQNIPGIEFGPAYQRVREHLIYRRGAVRPGSLAEIGGGDLEIATGSSHAKTLYWARDLLPDLVWVENASTDTQALLDGVADGTIDYTIADSTEFALAHDAHPELRIAFDFAGNQSLAWAASARDRGFLHDMNDYFARLSADGELAAIVKRYYGRSEDLQFVGARGFMRHLQSRLPLYKKWFEEAAEQSSQDWRFVFGREGPNAVDRRFGDRGQSNQPLRRKTEHLWRRSVFPAGVRKNSGPCAGAGPNLVCTRRLQHRVRPFGGLASADAKGRPRSGFMAGCA
jgi:membrane-bound lytic murein transglycosylase F